MLRNAKSLLSYSLRARDGQIGTITDLYFDDHQWNVRYFVVNTGTWLKSRDVLISPAAVNRPVWDEGTEEQVMPVDLTREQVRNSPGIDTAKPVSRQHEEELRRYYGWSAYWEHVPYAAGFPATDLPVTNVAASSAYGPAARLAGATVHEAPTSEPAGDPHLRSARETMGYHLDATDGEIGHVEDLLIDDRTWEILYLIVGTRNWWPGKKVILAPAWIRRIEWTESKVFVDLDRETIKQSPEDNQDRPLTPEYADRLHAHYRRPRPAQW